MDHCVVFGHDEATDRVFRTLEQKGFDVAYLRERRRITLLRREAPAGTTLSDIEDVFAAAVRAALPRSVTWEIPAWARPSCPAPESTMF